MPDASSPLTTDRLLAGRYRLVGRIARGGMAEVWEGHDDVLDRAVAIKILHAHLADEEGFAERFRREAIAAARLTHPGIVATYDAGTDGDIAFIVMELIRGRTLRQALEAGGPLPAGVAIRVAAEVADALAAAHDTGIVHRDVKPANILLCEEDGRLLRVKVADFGIAKLQAGGGDLTRTGAIVGTAKYLSPEQVEGRSPDARSDVYSLGVVLYEMLCGIPPHVAETELATALQHVRAEPTPLRQLRPGIPRALEATVLTAMAKNPGQRYSSARELRAALRAIDLEDNDDAVPLVVREPTPPAGVVPLARRTRRSWLPVLVVIAAAVAVLSVVATLVGGDGGTPVGGPDGTSAGAEPTRLAARSAHSFDPAVNGDENENRAALAIDGNPDTAWRTDRYDTRQFGNLKPGVGIWVELAEERRLRRLEVISPTEGWAATVYVSPAPGSRLEDWGRPVESKRELAAGTVAFDLQGRRGRFVLLWITDPGEQRRTEVAEITVSA